jgi:ssDNA-binding Zn-finger/Zn-ribbon topoisomerase 1
MENKMNVYYAKGNIIEIADCDILAIDSKGNANVREVCPKCGGKLVRKQGKYGEYTCCENKPNTCDYVKPKEVAISEHAKDCPKCKEGKLVVRKGKYGNFLGCSRYPECDYMEAFKKTTYYKKTK